MQPLAPRIGRSAESTHGRTQCVRPCFRPRIYIHGRGLSGDRGRPLHHGLGGLVSRRLSSVAARRASPLDSALRVDLETTLGHRQLHPDVSHMRRVSPPRVSLYSMLGCELKNHAALRTLAPRGTLSRSPWRPRHRDDVLADVEVGQHLVDAKSGGQRLGSPLLPMRLLRMSCCSTALTLSLRASSAWYSPSPSSLAAYLVVAHINQIEAW